LNDPIFYLKLGLAPGVLEILVGLLITSWELLLLNVDFLLMELIGVMGMGLMVLRCEMLLWFMGWEMGWVVLVSMALGGYRSR
jgi:hypothetical protein